MTKHLQNLTDTIDYLKEDEWIKNATTFLGDFEKTIILKMKTFGWDGDENVNNTRWTLTGSLFYSIIVITTIGECIVYITNLFTFVLLLLKCFSFFFIKITVFMETRMCVHNLGLS